MRNARFFFTKLGCLAALVLSCPAFGADQLDSLLKPYKDNRIEMTRKDLNEFLWNSGPERLKRYGQLFAISRLPRAEYIRVEFRTAEAATTPRMRSAIKEFKEMYDRAVSVGDILARHNAEAVLANDLSDNYNTIVEVARRASLGQASAHGVLESLSSKVTGNTTMRSVAELGGIYNFVLTNLEELLNGNTLRVPERYDYLRVYSLLTEDTIGAYKAQRSRENFESSMKENARQDREAQADEAFQARDRKLRERNERVLACIRLNERSLFNPTYEAIHANCDYIP